MDAESSSKIQGLNPFNLNSKDDSEDSESKDSEITIEMVEKE